MPASAVLSGLVSGRCSHTTASLLPRPSLPKEPTGIICEMKPRHWLPFSACVEILSDVSVSCFQEVVLSLMSYSSCIQIIRFY